MRRNDDDNKVVEVPPPLILLPISRPIDSDEAVRKGTKRRPLPLPLPLPLRRVEGVRRNTGVARAGDVDSKSRADVDDDDVVVVVVDVVSGMGKWCSPTTASRCCRKRALLLKGTAAAEVAFGLVRMTVGCSGECGPSTMVSVRSASA